MFDASITSVNKCFIEFSFHVFVLKKKEPIGQAESMIVTILKVLSLGSKIEVINSIRPMVRVLFSMYVTLFQQARSIIRSICSTEAFGSLDRSNQPYTLMVTKFNVSQAVSVDKIH